MTYIKLKLMLSMQAQEDFKLVLVIEVKRLDRAR